MAWQLIGGHVALDLVNTVAWRLDPERTVDRLTDPARLADWGAAALAGQVASTDPALPGVLDRVRTLRENLAGVLQAHLAGRPLPAAGMLRAMFAFVLAEWDVFERTGQRPLVDPLPPAEMLRKLERTATEWAEADTSRGVLPALHLISTLVCTLQAGQSIHCRC